MAETGIRDALLILLLLLLFVAVFAAIARRLKTPYPIVLVVAGLLLGFVPGIPRIDLEPDVIFLIVMPPLLYAAASVTSWRDFSRDLVSIGMLALGLVGFTVMCVALAGPWFFSGFDWRIGFVLGAAVCTTDAIAATSIAKRIRLPKRIVDLLEGESLLNDATGLLALEFATAMVVNGQNPTVSFGALRFLYLTLAGIASGLVLAVIVEWIEHRIDDGLIETAVSILIPYAAFLTAEAIHASGILAVVTAGLYLGRKSSEFLSPSVRLQTQAVWNSLTFILNGLVFVLIGLQLPSILGGVRQLSSIRIVLYGAIFSVFLILLRLCWTFPGLYVARIVQTRLFRHKEKRLNSREVFVVGWTGMRGVIALAAAISLPTTLADGSPFPYRDLIIFLTFCVILVTLVLQGLTLPPLIRILGLAKTPGVNCQELEAHRLVVEAAQAHLEDIRVNDTSSFAEVYDDLAQHYNHRLASINSQSQEQDELHAQHYAQHLELSRTLLDVERQAALRLRDEGRITEEVWREMENEMDLIDTRLIVAMDRQSR